MNYQKMCQKELTHNLKYGLSFSFGNVNNKKYLYVTCDNCSEQNKNNLSLWFWSWIIMLGWYDDIYINFIILVIQNSSVMLLLDLLKN